MAKYLPENDRRRKNGDVEKTYERIRSRQEFEARDLHEVDEALLAAVNADSGEPHPHWKAMARRRQGETIPGDGKVLKELGGAGTVYDWRASSWTPVNGGRITPLVFVHHIPVVPNVDGIADFITLRNVLVNQGLMVQSATDREGNVALYTPFNYLCYQAKGANQVSAGCEHMHMTTGESWTKRQLRAAAWVIQLCDDKHNITTQRMASIGSGDGVIRVLSRGQTEHEIVSDKAGYHDRSDPGPGYDHEYVAHAVRFWNQNNTFEGA